jgi:hypothetical protein
MRETPEGETPEEELEESAPNEGATDHQPDPDG